MPLIKEELFTCPNCDTKFMSEVLASYNTFGKHYSDLYTGSSDNPQPILHHINLCPSCGFAAFTLDFKTKEFNKEKVQKAIDWVEEFTGKKAEDFTPGDGYLEIAKYIHDVNLEQQSYIIMQSCYAYRELDDETSLQKARKLALEKVEEIIQKESFIDNDEELYYYLAGELTRLLGNEKKALTYYQKALTLASKNSFVYRLTKHQLSNPSEIIPKKVFKK
jgi:uncharacterized protein (DUF2225 family)